MHIQIFDPHSLATILPTVYFLLGLGAVGAVIYFAFGFSIRAADRHERRRFLKR